jgi:hypothetical protein
MQARARVAVVVHAPSRAIAPGARAALRALGYDLIAGDRRRRLRNSPAAACIATEREFARLPAEDRGIPTIVIRGRRGFQVADDESHVVGFAPRPGSLRDLYRMLQQALEATPRRVPRTPASLPARCIGSAEEWPGAILSLSEGGCLLRGKPLPDERVDLWFALPGEGLVAVQAERAWRTGDHTGFVFQDVRDDLREAIAGYVADSLASA